ncbi:unnamed protein product, partial [Laminaria digitata]
DCPNSSLHLKQFLTQYAVCAGQQIYSITGGSITRYMVNALPSTRKYATKEIVFVVGRITASIGRNTPLIVTSEASFEVTTAPKNRRLLSSLACPNLRCPVR